MQKCAAQVPRRCRDTAPPASTCAQPPLPRCPSMVAGPPTFINSACVPRAPPLRACVGIPPPFFPPGASSVIAPLKSVITICLWKACAQPPPPRCPRNLSTQDPARNPPPRNPPPRNPAHSLPPEAHNPPHSLSTVCHRRHRQGQAHRRGPGQVDKRRLR